jgi:hypothetical protein
MDSRCKSYASLCHLLRLRHPASGPCLANIAKYKWHASLRFRLGGPDRHLAVAILAGKVFPPEQRSRQTDTARSHRAGPHQIVQVNHPDDSTLLQNR